LGAETPIWVERWVTGVGGLGMWGEKPAVFWQHQLTGACLRLQTAIVVAIPPATRDEQKRNGP